MRLLFRGIWKRDKYLGMFHVWMLLHDVVDDLREFVHVLRRYDQDSIVPSEDTIRHLDPMYSA